MRDNDATLGPSAHGTELTMAEQVLQEGSLETISIVDLVVLALQSALPTRLEIQNAGSRRVFNFSEGSLVSLDSTGAAQSLLKVLAKRNKVLEDDAATLLEEAESSGDHIIEVLSRNGVFNARDLGREGGLWATLLLVQAVGWQVGTFRVLTIDPPAPDGNVKLDVRVPAALVKGVFKRMKLEELEAMLSPYGESIPTAVPTPTFSSEDLDLTEPQLGFLHSIDGHRSVNEMLRFSPLGADDTRRMLYVLQRFGFISFEDAEHDSGAQEASRNSRDNPEKAESISAVDMSSIRFSRQSKGNAQSATFHPGSTGRREEVSRSQSGPMQVDVGIAHVEQANPLASGLAPETSLSSLFDDMNLEPSTESGPPSHPSPDPARNRATSEEVSSVADLSSPGKEQPDLPPAGAGPIIPNEEWLRLANKDKDRVRQLRNELNRLKEANYFEYFGLTHESPDASFKKAFFQSAKRYHPDSLLDEPSPYRSLAEALFGQFSEAWETISDAALRDKYTRKHIFGEKDENDLAMEKVQQILDAETSFKNGLRLLNAGKLQDAMRHFKRAHEDYDEEGEYLAYYAFTLFRATRPSDPSRADEAVLMLERAIELSPNALKPYHLMGKVHILKGNSKTAKSYLRKVLKLKADDAEALRDYKRADALRSQGAPRKGGGSGAKGKVGGFFSRFGRKKPDLPKEKSEEQKFLDDLDMDLDF